MPDHRPLTQEQSTEAVVAGFSPSIRTWADEPSPEAASFVARSITAFKAAHADYFKEHKAYPPVSFLALSGGGNDGAFGSGILNGWSEAGTRPTFHLVTGVSTGALIAPLAFLGPDYDDKLKELFTKTTTDHILLVDIWTFLSGLMGGLSVTDVSPFVEKIRETYTPEILDQIAREHRKGRRLLIGTTNIEAQRGVVWDMGAIANSSSPERLALFHKIIQASAAIPGAFEPVFISMSMDGQRFNEIHVDGGVTSQVFLYPLKLPANVIQEFKKSGIDRNLYIVRNAKTSPEYKIIKDPGLFSITARAIESLTKNNGVGDLYRLYIGAGRDGTNYHVVQIPSSFTETSKEIFDPAYMSKLFELGRTMGREKASWSSLPPGVLAPAP